MDMDELAQSAVEAVAGHLAQRGTDAAGRLADASIDHVYQLISSRLQRTSAGQRMLGWLHHNPADEQRRARVAEVVANEVRSDPVFAESLGHAAERAGIFVQGTGASYRHIDNSGDYRNISTGRDLQIKSRHSYSQVKIGTGGLVVLGLVLLCGSAAVVVAGATNSSNLDSAVGRWEHAGDQPLPGFKTSATVLTVSSDSRFIFSFGIKMTPPGEAPPSGFPNFSSIDINCSGTVEPTGDHFTLRTTTGQCGTFEAKLSSDGRIMDVFVSNGSVDGSTALMKVSS